jgi:hypothetical protein
MRLRENEVSGLPYGAHRSDGAHDAAIGGDCKMGYPYGGDNSYQSRLLMQSSLTIISDDTDGSAPGTTLRA